MTEAFYAGRYGAAPPITAAADVKATYTRNAVFGVEDALLSTVGLAIGLAAGGGGKRSVMTALLVSTLAGALSLGVATFQGENVSNEIKHADPRVRREATEATAILLVAEVLGAAAVIVPFALTPDPQATARWVGPLALVVLAAVGYLSARYAGVGDPWAGAVKSAALGGAAMWLGFLVGRWAERTPRL